MRVRLEFPVAASAYRDGAAGNSSLTLISPHFSGGWTGNSSLTLVSPYRPPVADSTRITTMKTTSTASAIFHGLFGYSPSVLPVTPFITHW
jgi:hypothetical protein